MIEINLISNIVMWVLLLSLVVGFVTLPRKNLHQRKLALQSYGLPIQDKFPSIATSSIGGNSSRILGNQYGISTIVLYTAAGCKACNNLYPIITEYSKNNKVDITLFIDGLPDEIQQKIVENNIELPVFQSNQEILSTSKISLFPFAYYVSKDGIIFSKGGVQETEDLDLLLGDGKYLESRYGSAS